MKTKETYYELLKVDPKATIAEIVNAYHAAKNAFSKDSIAAYSLFSAGEADEFLKELEHAYMTLSNIDRKREYDRFLSGHENPAPKTTLPTPDFSSSGTPQRRQNDVATKPLQPEIPSGPLSGEWLEQLRESCGMSLEDVSRVTKIPLRVLQAMESSDTKSFPPRVYLQGFLHNLMKVYRMDGDKVKELLQYFDGLPR
jgi:curved DNA-binding protein CbpA